MNTILPPRVLIVDDEPFNVDYLVQEIEDLGLRTLTAADGVQALQVVAAEAPDLVLLDIMMPRMDGFEVLQHLKANDATRSIPVIIISAMDDISSVSKGIERGAEDYLSKPFEPVLLKARIHSSLEKKRLYDQEQQHLLGLERELELGRQIQAGFLPDSLPELDGWGLSAHFQAARQVAGDFYDLFCLPDSHRVALFLGDVSDKGVGAALYMTLFRSLLRVGASPDYFTRLTGLEPHAAPDAAESRQNPMTGLDEFQRLKGSVMLTNNYIADMHGDTGMFATLFFGLLNPLSGRLHYINAGHVPPLWINADGEITALHANGPALGVFSGIDYKVGSIQLQPGEMLLVYSDGVTDALNEQEEFFTQERLQTLLDPAHTAGSQISAVVAALEAHVAGSPQFDDITMLAIRRN